MLIDKAEELVKGLQIISCTIEHFDVWFVHLVVRQLDPSTRERWAISQENIKGFSIYDSLLKFLENRIISLTPLRKTGTDNATKNRTKNKTSKGNNCKPVSTNVAQKSEPNGKDERKE